MPSPFTELACVYRRVAGVLRSRGVAHRLLHRVLTRDRFARHVDLCDGRPLVGWLAALCEVPLAEGIERSGLVADLVREVAVPGSITQGTKGTCAAASVQILLAATFPAEYVRIVAGLASPEGAVQTAGGDTLQREPGTIAGDRSGRRTPSRLAQPAFMEYANGALEYDNWMDVSVDLERETSHRGLYAHQQARLLLAVTGREFETLHVRKLGVQRLLTYVALAISAGHLVPCGVDVTATRHAVLVRRIAADQVELYDSWGRIREMAIEKFTAGLRGAQIPSELVGPLEP